MHQSLNDPETFWGELAKELHWNKPFVKVLDNSRPPFTKWFVDGYLNACFNAIDRHVNAGLGDKVALIHDSPLTTSVRRVTYSEMYEQVSRLAGGLRKLGVNKGDRVVIYMPLIPEAIMAMLAVVRLGAVHSVVFGGDCINGNLQNLFSLFFLSFIGYAASELCTRIEHAEPKVVIAANCGLEPNKIIP